MLKKIFTIFLVLFYSSAKLYQVVSLFRHGARFHINSFYDGNSTLNQWGELTSVGMRQHYNMGKVIKKQYIDYLGFLNQDFSPDEVQVYSTVYNRTIQSVRSQLYGIWPPGYGPRLLNTTTKYHIPPFSSKNQDIEQKTFAFPNGHQNIIVKNSQSIFLQNCPNLDSQVEKNILKYKQDYQQMNMTYYPFIKRMSQIFNISQKNITFQNMSSLFDTLTVDKYLERQWPKEFNESDYQNIKHIHNWFNNVKFSNTASKIMNTFKINKILAEFDARINNLNSYKRKWTFLSGHDTDIIPLQVDLNFSSFQCIQQIYRKGSTDALNCQVDVGYASSLIFQLHSEDQKTFYIKIRSQGKYMNLCDVSKIECQYQTFKTRVQKLIIDVSKACGLKQVHQNQENLQNTSNIYYFL